MLFLALLKGKDWKVLMTNEKKIEPKNWKVRPETLRLVNIECASTGLTQSELAERSLAAYMDSKQQNANVSMAPTPIYGTAAGDPRVKYHEMVEEILTSGIRDFVFPLILNIGGWMKAFRDRQGKPSAYEMPGPTELDQELVLLAEVAKATSRRANIVKKRA